MSTLTGDTKAIWRERLSCCVQFPLSPLSLRHLRSSRAGGNDCEGGELREKKQGTAGTRKRRRFLFKPARSAARSRQELPSSRGRNPNSRERTTTSWKLGRKLKSQKA